MSHLETAAMTAKAAFAFGTAGISAVGAIGSRLFADALPPGSERLLDLGFAGIFIAALLYGMRIIWLSKLESDKKHDTLEKEIREGLIADLKEANKTRSEMIELMRRKETRDTN
jgi:hypothetical protein